MTNNYLDSHCHIHSFGPGSEDHTHALWNKLGLNPEAIIERAKEVNVTQFICVGTDLADSTKAIKFAQDHEGCFASVGIHPHEAKRYVNDKSMQAEFASLLTQPKVVAIGECGLDYYYNHSEPSDQMAVLKIQLDLAISHKLPVIFHVREAYADFWPLFASYKGSLRGVLHSFTDSQATLKTAIDNRLFIGVNGIATFARDTAQQEMYRSIPNEHLLLETDAPYLTPTPYRGNINEPKHIVRIAEYLAELRQTKLEDLAQATTDNAKQLFKL